MLIRTSQKCYSYVCPSVIVGLQRAAISDIGSDTSMALTCLKQIKDAQKIRYVENGN